MKRLAILRHASTTPGEPRMGDFDRPLDARGWRQSRQLGEQLGARGLRFDLVLASPAVRVRETLDAAGVINVRFDEELYLASDDMLLDAIRGVPDGAGSLLMAGHNPGVQRLIVDLARDDESNLRGRVIAGFPTGALALLALPIDRWADANAGAATLEEVILSGGRD